MTVFDNPYHLRDSLVKGAFKRFEHDHLFESNGSKTIMTDVFDFNSPFSPLGRFVDVIYLEKYMTNRSS